MNVLIIGSLNMDITGLIPDNIKMNDSNPGTIINSFGGVGKNIAENLARLGFNVDFIFATGDDQESKIGEKYLQSLNIKLFPLRLKNHNIDKYISFHDSNNNMIIGVNDMKNIKFLDKIFIQKQLQKLNKNKYDFIVVDANLNIDVLDYVCQKFDNVYFEAVSTKKAIKCLKTKNKPCCFKGNLDEAKSVTNKLKLENICTELTKIGFKEIIITNGKEGSYLYRDNKLSHCNSIKTNGINTSGAGDAFLSGYLYGKFQNKNKLFYGAAASKLTIESEKSNNSLLCKELLEKEVDKWF